MWKVKIRFGTSVAICCCFRNATRVKSSNFQSANSKWVEQKAWHLKVMATLIRLSSLEPVCTIPCWIDKSTFPQKRRYQIRFCHHEKNHGFHKITASLCPQLFSTSYISTNFLPLPIAYIAPQGITNPPISIAQVVSRPSNSPKARTLWGSYLPCLSTSPTRTLTLASGFLEEVKRVSF